MSAKDTDNVNMFHWRAFFARLAGVFCLIFGSLAWAEIATPSAVVLRMDDKATFWVDAPANTTPESALAVLRGGGRFLPNNQLGHGGANYGFRADAAWMHLPVAGLPDFDQRGKQWLLGLEYPPLDSVVLHVLGENGQLRHTQRGGDGMPFAQRPVQYRAHAFVLPNLETGDTLLVRIQTSGVLSLPVALYSENAFLDHVQRSYAALMLYLGSLVGLAAFNLLLGLQLRDLRYGWFVAFSLCMAGFQSAVTGLGMQYLWPEALYWQDLSAATLIALSCASGLQFTRAFLKTAQTMPRIDRLFLLGLVVAAIGLVCVVSLPLSQSTHANSTLAILSIVLVVVACVRGIQLKLPEAGFFLAAWATLLGGAIALVMHNNALIANNWLTQYGLLLGSAAQMVLLSLCLGSTVRLAQRETAAAKQLAEQEHLLVQDLQATKLRNQSLLAERDALLNNAVVGMVLSVNRQHTWVNDKFVAMMGYERAEMLNRNSQYLYADHEEWSRFGDAVRKGFATHGTFTQEMALRRKDGSVVWVHMAGALLKAGSFDDGVIWTILDVSALREAAEQMRAALEEQQKLAETRERFVAVTSHELRTPVASILGTLELFEHYGERLGEAEKTEMLAQINRAAQRLWDMTERVLFHGKAKAGEVRFAPQAVSLRSCLSDVIDEVCTHPAHPRDRFVQTLPQDDVRLKLDPSLLRHMLVNLLANAFKYSPTGTAVHLQVSLGQELELRVSDRGIGIPQADLPRLFTGFVRAGNVGDISGTGLGLSIVKHCVTAHGGRIDVHSVEGEGSTFVVYLPLILSDITQLS
jgi:PAS domain S-box-containing protein